MAKRKDWLPRTKTKRVAMAKMWLGVLETKAAEWGIPAQAVGGLQAKTDTAEAWLAKYASAERTRTVTAAANAAVGDLAAFMRDFKRRYFLVPPLTAADLVSLGLRPEDETLTEGGPPTAQPTGDISFPGIHLVKIKKISPVGGAKHGDGSDSEVRVHYGLTGTPTTTHPFRLETVPTSGLLLPYSDKASRRSIRFDFDGESGNMIYVSLQYERGPGKVGPYGPILKAFIP